MERAPRVEIQFPALFRTNGFSPVRRAGEGMILNLSRRGCMMRTETPVPIGTDLVLHLYRDSHPSRIQIDQATVRWSNEGRFGVEFLEARPEDWYHLQMVMAGLS